MTKRTFENILGGIAVIGFIAMTFGLLQLAKKPANKHEIGDAVILNPVAPDNSNEPTPLPLDQQVTEDYTPPEMLGLPDDHMEVAEEAFSFFPEAFSVTDAEKAKENAKKNVRIYELTRRAALIGKPAGKDIGCGPQQTSDCTGWAGARAKGERIGVQVYKGESVAADIPAPHYEYGITRRHADRQGLPNIPCGKGGAYPSVLALAGETWGLLPQKDGPAYNGRLSDQWGCKGVPSEYIQIGKAHAGMTAYPIRLVEELIEAIVNLYPCTLGVTYAPGRKYKADNRNCIEWNGSIQGGHSMSITAYDGTAADGYFFIQNSHGPKAQGATEPLQGEPLGGFWVPKAQVERWLKQRNCQIWAFSDVGGFPAEDKVDWSVFDQFEPPKVKMKETEDDDKTSCVLRSFACAV